MVYRELAQNVCGDLVNRAKRAAGVKTGMQKDICSSSTFLKYLEEHFPSEFEEVRPLFSQYLGTFREYVAHQNESKKLDSIWAEKIRKGEAKLSEINAYQRSAVDLDFLVAKKFNKVSEDIKKKSEKMQRSSDYKIRELGRNLGEYISVVDSKMPQDLKQDRFLVGAF